VLKVDGKEVARKKIAHTIPFLLPWDESFAVGSDTRAGVNDKDYKVPFRFTGTIAKLSFNLGPKQLAEADHKAAQQAVARSKD
jgi:hypothetical protein